MRIHYSTIEGVSAYDVIATLFTYCLRRSLEFNRIINSLTTVTMTLLTSVTLSISNQSATVTILHETF